MAAGLYDSYKRTGRSPKIRATTGTRAYRTTWRFCPSCSGQGVSALRSDLMSEATVSELKKMATAQG